MSDSNSTNDELALPATQTYSTPPTTDAVVANILRRCVSGSQVVGGGKLAIINPPTKAEEGQLRQRQAVLRNKLQERGKRDDYASAITDLLMCFSDRDRMDKRVVATFVREMQNVPLWAVQAACLDFRANRVPRFSAAKAPSTVELLAVANEYRQPFRAEAHTIYRVLTAQRLTQPATPQDKERGVAILKGVANRLRMSVASQNAADAVRWRIKEGEPPATYRTAEQLRAEFGEAFDALPDAKRA